MQQIIINYYCCGEKLILVLSSNSNQRELTNKNRLLLTDAIQHPLKLIFLLIKYCCFSGVEKNLVKLKYQWSRKNRTFYNTTEIPI